VSFAWPDVAAGRSDNILASGQALRVSRSGSALSFLVTASYGPASGTGRVVYQDGSQQTYTIGAPDWDAGCSATASGVAVYTPYRNRSFGMESQHVCVFFASVSLQAGKTVSEIILPDVSSGPVANQPSLHVFAVTIH
jgi:hypothetical protein